MLAIVVVNYGSSALLERNLAPLTRELERCITVVVDNRTDDEERDRVASLSENEGWHALLPDGNNGFGGGMNLGVELARSLGATRYLLLNPDASIAPDQLEALLARGDEDELALLSPRVVRPDGSPWFTGADLYLDDGRIHAARRRDEYPGRPYEPWISGAVVLVSDRLWNLVGGFDEDYFLYWEDVDLSHRVLAAGGSVGVAEGVTAIHAEGGTQGDGHEQAGGAKSELYYYYNVRNRLVFAAKHATESQLAAWQRHTRAVAWETILQGGRRQLLRSPRALVAAYRGIRDGNKFVVDSRKTAGDTARASA